MSDYMPLIAIVGSARSSTLKKDESEIFQDGISEALENRIAGAKAASVELGKALANHKCRIAIYSSNPDFIEAFVLKGYLAGEPLVQESVTCFYPYDTNEDFKSLVDDESLLNPMTIPGDDWEVSFYGAFSELDGILIIGGGSSTLAAGHIALGMGMPLMAIAEFGGSGKKIWEHLAQSKGNQLIEEDDVRKMSQWKSDSADEFIKAIKGQYDRLQTIKRERESELKALHKIAALWEQFQKEKSSVKKRLQIAGPFLFLFIVLLLAGLLVGTNPDWLFLMVFILGLAVAGGMGATIRLLAPNPPKVTNWTGILIGIAVGVIFSLLYLVPQLIGEASIVDTTVERHINSSRVQFISAMIFAVSVGFGFDVALEQLQQKAHQDLSQFENEPNP